MLVPAVRPASIDGRVLHADCALTRRSHRMRQARPLKPIVFRGRCFRVVCRVLPTLPESHG
ncbi:hypothetical protein BIFADO_01885 [Bifidobacterium adolescentis L2-32]|uniref:Uncharacterized protein n=1 Tax=Bifidobacterium adolescentis L2-32 TaxID=411481 RepID=A7A7P6_BIFAD|nr:hypothetical protein BIFADO_01885 [Bifidobacterium adolescentis L2-32]